MSTVSITRPSVSGDDSDCIEITLRHGSNFADQIKVSVSLEDFALAVTGRSDVPCTVRGRARYVELNDLPDTK